VAALEHLNGRGDVDMHRTALIGFFHGAKTILNAILDESVDLPPYTVDYVSANDGTIKLEVPEKGAIFYRVEYGAIPPPTDDPNHAGFFIEYGDFSH